MYIHLGKCKLPMDEVRIQTTSRKQPRTVGGNRGIGTKTQGAGGDGRRTNRTKGEALRLL